MKPILVAIIVLLCVLVVWLSAAVVRLENYRYANYVGMCDKYSITDPIQRMKRDECLEHTETRTHWFWHVLYGLKVL